MRLSHKLSLLAVLALLALGAVPATAKIYGITPAAVAAGPTGANKVVNLTAAVGNIATGDGFSYSIWGFAETTPTGGVPIGQYPGPTLLLNQGDTVIVNVTNNLTEPVSFIVPGFKVTAYSYPIPATGPVTPIPFAVPHGDLTMIDALEPEVYTGQTVSYQFTATKPGTYYYQSGSDLSLEQRLGLFGAIVVYPSPGSVPPRIISSNLNAPATNPPYAGTAYTMSTPTDETTAYDREYLFLFSDMDPLFMNFMAQPPGMGSPTFDLTTWKQNYFFINGRNLPDTLGDPNPARSASLPLPNQPYNAAPVMHPGEKILLRMINMGNEFHPFHHHGNHATLIAENGNPLKSVPDTFNGTTTIPGSEVDLSEQHFTEGIAPGETVDLIFTWTGEKLGWDPYGGPAQGHTALQPFESIADHLKQPPSKNFEVAGKIVLAAPATTVPAPYTNPAALPTVMLDPVNQVINGEFWSGSPFLGDTPPANRLMWNKMVMSPLLNPNGTLKPMSSYFMWHSHAERELTNYNTFPGGLATMMEVRPWSLPINPATDR